jgi:hypothetical protein
VTRERLLRDGYLVLGAAFVLLRLLSVRPWDQSVDAYAYWSTGQGIDYGNPGAMGAYLYSPAFAQLLRPLTWVPWPVFAAGWTVLNLVVLRLVVGRLALPVLLLPPVAFEIVSGNVHLLYALAIVAGTRGAALWAIPILTKITPGVGVLWFVVRRQWRAAAVALGVTAGIVVVSFVLDPGAWRAWVDALRLAQGQAIVTPGWYLPVPLAPRLVAAVVLVVAGAATRRHWTVPIAVTLALPILWLNGLSVLVALVPMLWPVASRGSVYRAERDS